MPMSRKKVLWVDDEIEFLRSHIMFLETRGYSVTPVFSGDDAIHILKETPKEFDIVLLDEQMPGKDGLTTLEEIKEFLPDLPVVMVTKSEEEQLMEDALGMKIDGYLTKPVNPSQILSVCKRLLHSKQIISGQIKQRFVRDFSEIRSTLQNPLQADDWYKMHFRLSQQGIELQGTDDEGIRQAHTGQRSDANKQFSSFYARNYMHWLGTPDGRPTLTPDVMDRMISPLVERENKICMIVFDSLRLDQYLTMEPYLKKSFEVKRRMHYATIPTSPGITRRSLLSGKFPVEISRELPDLWVEDLNCARSNAEHEQQLAEIKLTSREMGLKKKDIGFASLTGSSDTAELLKQLDEHNNKKMLVVVVDFFSMLMQSRSSAKVLQEIAPDEDAFRRLTQSWFQYSSLRKLFNELAKRGRTVALTASNGCVFCTRGTELYGDGGGDITGRYRFGERVTSDERYALFISEPQRLMLPEPTENTGLIILRENYYFIRHDKFENYQLQYSNTFQNGGISMDEVLVPSAILRPL